MNLRKAAEMALEALTEWKNFPKRESKAIAALKEALAQPEQEPVAYRTVNNVLLEAATKLEDNPGRFFFLF